MDAGVVGGGTVDGAESWAKTGNTKTNAAIKTKTNRGVTIRIEPFWERITLIWKSSNLENDVQDGGRVRGLAIPHCRLKANLFGGANCGVVQTVP